MLLNYGIVGSSPSPPTKSIAWSCTAALARVGKSIATADGSLLLAALIALLLVLPFALGAFEGMAP
ncbi:hypothetical protein JQ628_04970 [Bradyrhizobium lablabi]|uniref:hypothetical protein n=1 Tax=Bradyrhizobium lablabi TaxID=722472 RepID=UPI001BA7A704|nr:hypothetical protein [Bradyrhizobium lablabi]MBR1120860.1 hypothetical protein [Bradyrhizobium lablabi]